MGSQSESTVYGQTKRIAWLRTQQQTQMAVDKIIDSTGYIYTTGVSLINTMSTDTQFQESFEVLWF